MSDSDHGDESPLLNAPQIWLDSVGSTNPEALRRAAARRLQPGEALWVIAQRQTAGRGRRGRHWVSEPGNLYCSLAWCPPTGHIAQAMRALPFACALAVRDALAAIAARYTSPRDTTPALALKWPNDVLADGRKIAGLLIERDAQRADTPYVIGMGVNLAHHPAAERSGMADAPWPATDLRHWLGANRPVAAPEDMFDALMPSLGRRLATLLGEDGLARIRKAWLAHAIGIGAPITVRLMGETISGIFEKLDPQGYLVLRRPDGVVRRIASGDVFLTGEAGTGRCAPGEALS